MTEIELISELHANTRRTRITYRGRIAGQEVAIKCYRRPLFGLIHWVRAQRQGLKIRRAGGPVPEIVYSGWMAQRRCFCFATAFLEGYRPMREVLREEASEERQFQLISLLGARMADIHHRGIEQPDGNLTNFLVNGEDDLAMVDEDDIRVYDGPLPLGVALSNLANVAARLPDKSMVEAMLKAYLAVAYPEQEIGLDQSQFWTSVSDVKGRLEAKRVKRNINPERRFD